MNSPYVIASKVKQSIKGLLCRPNGLLAMTAIIVLGGCKAISYFWLHSLAVIFSLIFLSKISKYWAFWFLFTISLLFAQEPRFSIEYYLIAMGFMSWSLSNWWLSIDDNKRKNFFNICFTIIVITHYLELEAGEYGSLIMWLPIYLALYLPDPLKNRMTTIGYSLSGLALGLSAKLASFVALIVVIWGRISTFDIINIKIPVGLGKSIKCRMSRYDPWLVAALVAAIYWLNDWQSFKHKSIIARLNIWNSAWQAGLQRIFEDQNIFGYGFGNFVIDFSTLRIIKDSFGSRSDQFVSHGHSVLVHYFFELGLAGILLFIAFAVLIFIKARRAFLPLMFICLVDSVFNSFSQILLGSLLFAPLLIQDIDHPILSKLTKQVFAKIPESKFSKLIPITALLISLAVQIPSLIGHYYFERQDYDSAIKWDKSNSLYYMMRGFKYLNQDTKLSEQDFTKAIELTPNVGFFYGYLAAAQLANNKLSEAKANIQTAIKYSGENAYWHLIAAFINHDNKKLYTKHMQTAFKQMPELQEVLSNPDIEPTLYIGGKSNDLKVIGFYRKGENLILPLPYIH